MKMADLSPAEHDQMATDLAEGIDVFQTLFRVSNEDRIQVIKKLLDREIGTDPSADFKTIPGLTPELTETITDPLLDVMANVINNAWFKPKPGE
jgi:hypothetical protein